MGSVSGFAAAQASAMGVVSAVDMPDEFDVVVVVVADKSGLRRLRGMSVSGRKSIPTPRNNRGEEKVSLIPPGVILSDLARGKAAVVSSEENAGTIAKNLTDGDEKTRWGSAHRDGEWIQLDLGKTYKISTVELDWENARAVDYDVLVSVDGQAWKAAAEQRGAKGGLEKHVFKPLSARYVKVLGIKRNTTYGISLFRFSVFARE